MSSRPTTQVLRIPAVLCITPPSVAWPFFPGLELLLPGTFFDVARQRFLGIPPWGAVRLVVFATVRLGFDGINLSLFPFLFPSFHVVTGLSFSCHASRLAAGRLACRLIGGSAHRPLLQQSPLAGACHSPYPGSAVLCGELALIGRPLSHGQTGFVAATQL